MNQDQFEHDVMQELHETDSVVDLHAEYEKQNNAVWNKLIWNDVINSFIEDKKNGNV